MMVNVKITDKQALKMAKIMYSCNFHAFGIGNFHINTNEMAEIIKITLNEHIDTDAFNKLNAYYEKLKKEYLY